VQEQTRTANFLALKHKQGSLYL